MQTLKDSFMNNRMPCRFLMAVNEYNIYYDGLLFKVLYCFSQYFVLMKQISSTK